MPFVHACLCIEKKFQIFFIFFLPGSRARPSLNDFKRRRTSIVKTEQRQSRAAAKGKMTTLQSQRRTSFEPYPVIETKNQSNRNTTSRIRSAHSSRPSAKKNDFVCDDRHDWVWPATRSGTNMHALFVNRSMPFHCPHARRASPASSALILLAGQIPLPRSLQDLDGHDWTNGAGG